MTVQEAGSAGTRVLAMDDSVDTARMMRVLLRRAGYEVRGAHDGPATLKVSIAFEPEVVLLDLTLPGMTVRAVASRLRERGATAAALIVAVSGYGDRGVPPGFDRLLIKPVDHVALLELFREGRARRPGNRGPARRPPRLEGRGGNPPRGRPAPTSQGR